MIMTLGMVMTKTLLNKYSQPFWEASNNPTMIHITKYYTNIKFKALDIKTQLELSELEHLNIL